MAKVCVGDLVRIYYTGSLEDGSVFDATEEGATFEFVAGGEEVIPGMSEGVLDMELGEKKCLVIPPERAYGQRFEEAELWVPLAELPDGVQVGDQLRAEQEGMEVLFHIRELDAEQALLDANHPLAGQTLHFDVELVEIESKA